MTSYISNIDHFKEVLSRVQSVKHTLWIGTDDIKDLYVEVGKEKKRIATTLFLWFLNNNHILYREDGSNRMADNTLVTLTLMIAESRTEEKDVMVKVVVNLIN